MVAIRCGAGMDVSERKSTHTATKTAFPQSSYCSVSVSLSATNSGACPELPREMQVKSAAGCRELAAVMAVLRGAEEVSKLQDCKLAASTRTEMA